MSGNAQFDASLPTPYADNWRVAYRADSGDSPRMASYQAPGGEALPFVQKGFRFSGGQSQDMAEYPFGGLWSHEYLNEKPQALTVEGFLRGPTYIVQRNKLIEALRMPTDDDNPGYIDLPFWGRFPVVVGDNYEISENTDEQGQCAVFIPFRRAGVSITERLAALPVTSAQFERAVENLQAAAIDDFESRLTVADTGSSSGGGDTGGGSDPGGGGDTGGGSDINGPMDTATFASGFAELKKTLLAIVGRIQGAKTTLDMMTGKALGIINLINQGVRSPRELAQAQFNAVAAIVGGIMEIKNSIVMYGRMADRVLNNGSTSSKPSLPPPDNEKNVLLLFLSANTYTLPIVAATAGQTTTKKAIENLYRTVAFSAAIQIVINYDLLTHQKATGYWQLIEKLEESIDKENPAVYTALQDMRTTLARALSEKELSGEMVRTIPSILPLLYVAYYLGCDEDKIRELNSIPDSFVITGKVIYV
jgi:hypothetical protein